MKKYLLIFLLLSIPCFGQDINTTPTPELKPPTMDIRRFKSAIRQEQAKTPLSVVKVLEDYDSTGGIYKSITKASIKESFPFGIEFDGKHFRLEPLSVEFDNYETAVDLTAYKEDTTKVSIATKETNTLTYPAISGITYSVFADTEKWKKVVTIDSKQFSIPKGAKYLILSFKVDTNFTIPKGRMSDRFEMTEDCWLEPAKVGIVGSTEYITIEHEFSSGVYYKYIPVSALTGTIATDLDFTFGSEEVFNTATTTTISVDTTSATTGVIAYKDIGGSGYCEVIAYTLSGTDFTFGTAESFTADPTSYIRVDATSTTTGVISFQHNTSYGSIIAYTLSGTDFTFGTLESFVITGGAIPFVSASSTTTGVITYYDSTASDTNAYIIAYTLSGTDFTFGTAEIFNSGQVNYVCVSAHSTTSGVIAYRDADAGDKGMAIAYTLSGTDFTFGSESIFNNGNTATITVDSYSTTGVICYQDNGNSGKGTAIAYTLSSTTLTFGTEEVFNNVDTEYISVSCSSSTKGVISGRNASSPYYSVAVAYELSGTDFTFGTSAIFNAASTLDTSISNSSETTGVIVYRDGGNSWYGTAIAYTLYAPSTAKSPAAALIEILSNMEPTP